jgi:two-component system LytT family response regulator
MKNVTAVIVEDSRLARNELKELIQKHGHITVLGEADHVDAGLALIKEQSPDVLFLDINMPEKDGFQLLELLDEVPITIFTTAFDEYAIKSFEYNALDYLLKPINDKRFAQAMVKVMEKLTDTLPAEKPQDQERLTGNSQIFIKDGEKCWLIKIGDISHFEIVGNYTRVFFNNERPMLYKSLNQIEDKLPELSFFRANRQQIINTNFITEVVPWFNGKLKLTMQNGDAIEVSRRQSYLFKDKMSL